ncbi:hypothetical protein DNTS_001501 [Danionella cerebrum]|uniref:PLD phosphodiesterase domain-containing protein n=1 Tax=Danionella cerebrum TaxID=2873325 RepID=A0A553R257_9TELE|nr:hypothetical protein DNTS_001501 [Danionella translucida]
MSESSRLRELHQLTSPYKSLHDTYVSNKQEKCPVPALVATGCLIVMGVLLAIVVIEKLRHGRELNERLTPDITSMICNETWPSEQSSIVLVESFPEAVHYGINISTSQNLFHVWKDLLSSAKKRIDVASFYWSLTDEDIAVHSSSDRPVCVRVVTSIPTLASNSSDLDILEKHGVEVRRVNFGHLTRGILHSKFWIIDDKHIYIGSANMDWRALTQVRELGAVIFNSSALASDLLKVFQSYWVMSKSGAAFPEPWPREFETNINEQQPLNIQLDGEQSQVYLTASPPVFCPASRTRDLDAILSAISGAQEFIHISVMEFYPAFKFFGLRGFWPELEDALKQSAFNRNVSVCLLVSCGRESDPSVWPFLRSLDALHSPSNKLNIDLKLFIIPVGNQSHVPYTRVNHSKFMVTDKVAYVGTSNWSADYFNTTAGVGLVVSHDALRPNSFHQRLRDVFLRDWDSKFAVSLSELKPEHDCAFAKL